MKILLTNDDGYHADGLQQLASVLSREHECYVVAPADGMSCCSHSVTNADPLLLKQLSSSGWSVAGTPADCVRLALLVLQIEPDWIISGVNHGGNLGIDTLYSGTVAGAREGCLFGIRSVAISQYIRRDIEKDWLQTALRAKTVLDHLWGKDLRSRFFWNVNLPALLPSHPSDEGAFPVTYCRLEHAPLGMSYEKDEGEVSEDGSLHRYQSNYQLRPRKENSDVGLCFAGHATITRLRAFRT
jgi:5'-nucleotidase